MEKAVAPHSSTLAWTIPWMEEPGRLQSMGWLRVGHDWVTSLSLFTFMHWRRKWQPTLVFLLGESQGWGSLVGCTELDTTEATSQQQQRRREQEEKKHTEIMTENFSRLIKTSSDGKNICLQWTRLEFDSWVRKIPCGRECYSCLENPMYKGAWQATVRGVAKSQTGLSD